MMHWRYRARKRIINGQVWFDVVEYIIDGKSRSWARESMAPGGESRAVLIKTLEKMLKDCKEQTAFTDEVK